METLLETLRAALAADGRGVNELGRASGVGGGIVSRFLRGERGVSLTVAGKLASALGLVLVKREETGRHSTRARSKGERAAGTRKARQTGGKAPRKES
ncbi:MAG: helix-turn-helix transcriptional regulator [Phycisphaerales bacterium]|nr:helix-turn-helix transcriptional regulator [Phycisphaerales bacterium]